MAYLISDMAAGSNAALQMQQNMAAAPYVKDQAAAVAEETQLKLQQDRIKAAYAPQEAALKLQQDQAITAKTKLEATMLGAKVQTDESTKKIELDFANDPANKDLPTAEYASKLAKLMFSVDPVKAEKMMSYSANADVKQAAADAKKADAAFKTIGAALSSTAGANPQQFQKMIEQWSPEQVDAVEKQIPGFMNERDPARQKAQLESLLWTHSNATLQMKLQHDDAEHAKDRTLRLELANVRANAQAAGRQSIESKTDIKANTMFTTAKSEIDRKYQKQEDKAEEDLKDAKLEAEQYGKEVTLLGRNPTERATKANAALAAASDRVKEIDKKRRQEYLDTAKRLPKGETRDAILEALGGSTDPTDDTPARKEPDERNSKGRKPDVVPSNKPAVSGLQSQVEASGQTYEPNKYDYRVAPDGSIQRKAK